MALLGRTGISNLKYSCQPTGAPLTNAQANALIQQLQTHLTKSSNGPKPGTCRTCGKPGHWARECPQRNSSGPRPNNQNKNSDHPNNPNRHTQSVSWKNKPPPQTPQCSKVSEENGKTKWKFVHNNHTFFRVNIVGAGVQHTGQMNTVPKPLTLPPRLTTLKP